MSTSKASPLLAAPTGALLGDGSRTDNFSYQVSHASCKSKPT